MKERHFRKELRNKNINYAHGRFFVTFQVAHNMSLLGVILGERCVLNELGQEVRAVLEELPRRYPALELGEYVIMPNHVHMILGVRGQPGNRAQHLGFYVGRFKGATAFLYGRMKREGRVPDIGEHLWLSDYWEDLVSSEQELRNYERYIRNNPRNWTRDRWGAVTQYVLGEVELLNAPRRAFVASQEYDAAGLVPRRFELSQSGTSVPRPPDTALISTFTSRQERAVLHRALARKQRIIHVCPQGVPRVEELSAGQRLALEEKRLLFISPQQHGGGLNKKVAAWCNEYVLRQAAEIWVGDISPNGMLAMMLRGLSDS